MEWDKLLSKARLRRGQPQQPDPRSEFQRDYDRIVFSSAFRRMQDKTQVFPLSESDYVRTRLTHSVEASCVGRSLGTLVGAELLKKNEISNDITAQDVGNIVAAACLAHDIGNPPFGHSGEEAIGTWFATHGFMYIKELPESLRQEFVKFEGNAQGFRILSRLQYHRDDGGLQLTYATLGAFTKYPKFVDLHSTPKPAGVSEKKFGFFEADRESFLSVAQAVGLKQKSAKSWSRHPLAFLTEAADDICYCIVDFEDGVRRSRVPFTEAEELLKKIAFRSADEEANSSYKDICDEAPKIEYLRACAINSLVHASVGAFMQNRAKILDGTFEQSIVSNTEFYPALKAIKDRSVKDIYSAPSVVHIEAAGFEVLGGLLERFVPALVTHPDNRTAEHKKLLQLIPPHFDQGSSPYERLLSSTDFVSGMTDTFAVTLYRRLRGIELPRS